MWLIRAALGNVYAVLVLALLILVLGLIAVASIPVDILPAFNAPAVQVMTFYSGMPGVSGELNVQGVPTRPCCANEPGVVP